MGSFYMQAVASATGRYTSEPTLQAILAAYKHEQCVPIVQNEEVRE
jgi:hypothetical protein